MQKIEEMINSLSAYEKDIDKLISNGVTKVRFSIFGSDYKTFNQNIVKTIQYLNDGYGKVTLNRLKSETTLSSVMLFVQNSDSFKGEYGENFDEVYQYLVRSNIRLIDDSTLNRLFFKALSRLSFISNSGAYVFPTLPYDINSLKNLNKEIDGIVSFIKSEGLKQKSTQGGKSNIIAWIKNMGVEEDNLKNFLSLLGDEQINMYEQKLWFLIGYLSSHNYLLETIIEESFNIKIKSIKHDFISPGIEHILVKESSPKYNDKNTEEYLKPQAIKMINNFTSQESLLLLSLLTKPFSILYGVSGTGKSRVVKELWKKMYGENYGLYFVKQAVPPNWFDESEIIGRYNAIEKYVEGSFIKILEKAIRDPEHSYVYLLDEMNLSHIEQYFAQYLSAIEDLEGGNGWIHIGDTLNFSRKEFLNVASNSEFVVDIENPISLVKKYNFLRGKLSINGKEIFSDKSFAAFQAEIFKYVVDECLDEDLKEEDFMKRFGIETIQSLTNKGFDILGEEKISDLGDKGFTIYIKKPNWQGANNYFYYKGYLIDTMHNNDSRVNTIKRLVNNISEYALKNLELIFAPNTIIESQEVGIKHEGIILYHYDNDLVGKSLKIPKNLFVVGTINLDETTKSISPKVVDRANIIEFNDIDNYTFLQDNGSFNLQFLEKVHFNLDFEELLSLRLTKEKWDLDAKKWELNGDNQTMLQKLYDYLKRFKLHFSYRTINEILTFVAIGKQLVGNQNEDKLLDIAIMQKILPKLNGVIDPSFKLSHEKREKYLYYNVDETDENILSNLDVNIRNTLIKGIFQKENEFSNTSIKLQRMQQFFDTYQNVNYFLS